MGLPPGFGSFFQRGSSPAFREELAELARTGTVEQRQAAVRLREAVSNAQQLPAHGRGYAFRAKRKTAAFSWCEKAAVSPATCCRTLRFT